MSFLCLHVIYFFTLSCPTLSCTFMYFHVISYILHFPLISSISHITIRFYYISAFPASLRLYELLPFSSSFHANVNTSRTRDADRYAHVSVTGFDAYRT